MRAFVIGSPIAHSRSPLIHNAWIEQHGLDASYEAMEIAPADLGPFMDRVRASEFVGGNVTLPHKEAVLSLTEPDDTAQRIGAANTVWRDDGTARSTNTDAEGWLASLDAAAPGWNTKLDQAVVLGAGGAARAIVHALAERGAKRIVVVNRTRSRIDALTSLGPVAPAGWEGLESALREADFVVNTTSRGMGGQSDPDWPPSLAEVPEHAVVNDIVYAPLRTAFLEEAAARGLRTVDGLGMLLHQAVPGFQRWFGVRPEVTARLRRRVVHDLGENEPVFLALTGSIGMGKSTTAGMFRDAGVPVYDADAAVHELYRGAAAPLIEAAFPGTTGAQGVDRAKLSAWVVGNADAMRRLEAIVHPLVAERQRHFREEVRRNGHAVAVLDIPLLFETGGERGADAVVVVTAPPDVQRERVLSRGTMDAAAFEAILARQTPDAEKRRRADFVLDTSRGLEPVEADVRRIVGEVSRKGWQPALTPG